MKRASLQEGVSLFRCHFPQIDVAVRDKAVTINMHGHTLEVITTRELKQKSTASKQTHHVL